MNESSQSSLFRPPCGSDDIAKLSADMFEVGQSKEKAQEQVETSPHLESLGALAGGIAHDFNNLLSVILGNVSLANKHLHSPEQMATFLSRIQQASTSAAGLCTQMLSYVGKGDVSFKPINLSKSVQDMARLLEVSLFKGIHIQYDLAEELPNLKADATQIQQVIMNLITNANEAMKGKQGIIVVRTGLTTVNEHTPSLINDTYIEPGVYVYLEVSDEGCGMNDETVQKIFEPFFTTKFTGRGLGMNTMHGIVRGHSGLIQLESEVGKGSTFRVAFPAVKKHANQDDTMVEEYDALRRFQPSGKVLLVDDEDVVLETMQVMLEDLGYESLLASDGLQALELYQHHHADIELVLLDMTMPKMSGKACMTALQKLNPEVKIILSSGYSKNDVFEQFKGIHFAGFLQKPCGLKALYRAMKNVR